MNQIYSHCIHPILCHPMNDIQILHTRIYLNNNKTKYKTTYKTNYPISPTVSCQTGTIQALDPSEQAS